MIKGSRAEEEIMRRKREINVRREKERITRIKKKKNQRKTLADKWRETDGGEQETQQ